MAVLIDAKGHKWNPVDPRLGQYLRSSRDHHLLTRYAVENLGWILLQVEDRYARVSCRPAFVEEASLAATFLLLHEMDQTPIALDLYDTAWDHRIFRDLRTFSRFLSSLVAGRKGKLIERNECFLSCAQSEPEQDLAQPASLAAMVSRTANNVEELQVAFDKLFHGRWYACKIATDNGHSMAVAIGTSFTPFNPAWSVRGKGQSLCSYADDAYGNWIARHHRLIIEQDLPHFDQVDAIANFPRIGKTRLRYRRLTMPLPLRDGTRLILSAAVTDSRINLRRQV